MMASRVLLLMLAVLTFAATWSLDEAPRRSARSTLAKAVESEAIAPASSLNSRDDVGSIPVPGNIAPGEYSVVDNDGRVVRVSVAASEENAQAAVCSRYRVVGDEQMWQFVRIHHMPASHGQLARRS